MPSCSSQRAEPALEPQPPGSSPVPSIRISVSHLGEGVPRAGLRTTAIPKQRRAQTILEAPATAEMRHEGS